MFGKNARRLIALFREVVRADDCDSMQYLNRYASEIEVTRQLLEYLYLAEADKRSHLGWRPTHLLLEIMNQRKKLKLWSDKPVPREDRLIIELLCDAAFGDARHTYPGGSFRLAFGVLYRLGLMQLTREGDVGANQHLLRLFADAHYSRWSVSVTRQALRETVSAWEELRREELRLWGEIQEELWEEAVAEELRAKERLSAKPRSRPLPTLVKERRHLASTTFGSPRCRQRAVADDDIQASKISSARESAPDDHRH